MYNAKDAHELRKNPAEGAKTRRPALRGKLDLQRRAPLQFKL